MGSEMCIRDRSWILLGAKIGTVEELLQADELRAFSGGLSDQIDVLVDHRFADLLDRRCRWFTQRRLNQSAFYISCHDVLT